ncbi:MAG: phosphate acetyltransferase [Desulfovibrionaceae bacterium]|nr:phosphate acetyltransferase [Desulfovibrionaceae bacterium]
MAHTLYITAAEAHSGISAIAPGVMQLMRGRVRRPAVFRPIISDPGPDAQDRDIALLTSHFHLDTPYAETFACTLDEARELINAGQSGALMDKILRAYTALESQYDFILCEGTDFTGKDTVFEYKLNTDIAATLGAPVLLVTSGENRSAGEVQAAIQSGLDIMADKGVRVAAAMVTRATMSDTDAQALRSRFAVPGTAGASGEQPDTGDNAAPLVFVLHDLLEPVDEPGIQTALDHFGRHVDSDALGRRIEASSIRMSPLMFQFRIMEQARKQRMRIVLPEGGEDRILRAADILLRSGVADIILLGDTSRIGARARDLGLNLDKARIVQPDRSPEFEDYAATYQELRKHKGISLEQARERMSDATYFGTMMVYKGHADGLVSGSVNTTAHTVRPALEFIKTKPGYSIVSSIFFMCLRDRVLTFGDCAINPNPTAAELADIAVTSAETSRIFGLETRVAMLSYSSGSSGHGADVDQVIEATRLARERAPELPLTGPIQYDAAIDPKTARTKMPGDPVAGRATVFIFPDLNTGNNTYKAVQRAAGALAVGPVLQGLRKPVNDLSRGATVADIVNTVAITAVQAQAEKNQESL